MQQRAFTVAGPRPAQAPRRPADLMVREDVAAVLGLAVDELDDRADLVVLGMDSIRVMRLAAQWRRAGYDVGYADLLEHRTLDAWAGLVAARAGRPGAHATATTPEDPGAPFALSPMQSAYWAGRGDDLPLGGVGSQFYCELDGTGVDAAALEGAVRALLVRHEMLRVRLTDDGRQQVMPVSAWPGLVVNELDALPVAEAERRAEELRHHLSQRRMDAGAGQVVDVLLTVLPGGRTRVHLAVEMLVCDAQSFRILLRDLARLYGTLVGDTVSDLPAVDVRFADCLRRRPDGRGRSRPAAEAWWRARTPTLPGPPELPLARDPRRLTTRTHKRRAHTLRGERWEAFVGQARQHGVLASMALAAVYGEVLGGWSATPRFLLNMPFYDRDESEPQVADLVGDFTNTVLVALDTAGPTAFVTRVRELSDRFHADLAHAAHPGVEVLRDLVRARGTAVHPAPVVFTAAVNLGELFDPELRARLGEPGYTMSTSPQVWLDCQATRRDGDLFVNWDAVEELFPDGVLDAMFSAFTGLLEHLVDGDWTRPVEDLRPAGQVVVRERVNATTTTVPPGGLLDDVLLAAARNPAAPAVLDPRGRTTSAGELADRALRVATLLQQEGVRPGDTVGVTLRRGPDQIAAVLGTLAAGAAYVPVGVDQPRSRRDRILGSAGARCVLVERDDGGGGPPGLVVPRARSCRPLSRPVPVDPRRPAYVIYTSGSTGEPKGVEVSHRSALNTVRDITARYGIGAGDRALALSALDFDLSVYDVFGLLGAGGSLVLVDEEDRREAAVWVGLAADTGVTVWNSVPALLEMALAAGPARPDWAATLRLALVSGDWVPIDLADRLAVQAPACRMVALGGATEAAIWSNAFDGGRPPPGWPSVPYGRPLANQRFRVVDERGRDRPDWVPGELWIGGEGVALGYRHDAVRTAAAFVGRAGHRWYRTGDVGRYHPDGLLEFLGRRDQQVKIGGHRIELGEVEATLACHPAVAAAVALAVDAPTRRLVAVVVPAPGHRPHPDGLRGHCAEQVPGYLVPDLVQVRDALPLTANGKVDRAALAAGILEGLRGRGFGAVDDPASDDLGGPTAEDPRPGVETRLAALWSDLLGQRRVLREDSFFALGGDSLSATRMIAALRSDGVTGATLGELFRRPTLAAFARGLRLPEPRGVDAGTDRSAGAGMVRARPQDRYLPFPATEVQRAYWMGRSERFLLGGIGSHWYWELDGEDVDLARLERAWNRLVQRHEMLRAVFDDDARQRVIESVPPTSIPVQDVPVEQAGAAIQGLRERMSHRVADPGRWPLNEVHAVRYGRRTRLALSFDYIVLDALSIVVVLAELGALYQDEGADLPLADMSFRDYVLTGGPDPRERATALRHWSEREAALPPPPALALAARPDAVRSPRFTRREARVTPEAWAGLATRARRCGTTPSAALATAYAEVLGAWSTDRDLTLTLTVFDRRDVHPRVAATVGDFTSLTLAEYRPVDGETFADAAVRYGERIWTSLEHRAVSAVEILRERGRRSGGADVAMPVVFTSALGLPAQLSDAALPFGDPVWGLSQTPQAWLDCQVSERAGALHVTWDAVEQLFDPAVLDAMFTAFVRLLDRLAASDWRRPLAPLRAPGGPPDAPGALAQVTAAASPTEAAAASPPRDDLERALAALWADLLGHDVARRSDNFFALGGDSLSATRLVEEVRARWDVPVSLRLLLTAPTLAELADLIRAGREGAAPTGPAYEEGVL